MHWKEDKLVLTLFCLKCPISCIFLVFDYCRNIARGVFCVSLYYSDMIFLCLLKIMSYPIMSHPVINMMS